MANTQFRKTKRELHHALSVVLGTDIEDQAVFDLKYQLVEDMKHLYDKQCRRDYASMAHSVCLAKIHQIYIEELGISLLLARYFQFMLKGFTRAYCQKAEINQAIARIQYAEKRSEYRAW